MAIVATGQLTITDLNDARQLISYIGASQSRTVIVSGSTYVPNYGQTNPNTNQVLTPQLYIAGTSSDVAQDAIATKWFYQTNGTGTPTEITTANAGSNYTLTKVGTNGLYSLTIKANVLQSANSVTYICELTYPDATTGLNIVSKSEIEVVKVVNGNNGSNGVNAIMAVLSNESANVPARSDGSVISVAGATTTMSIYNGATDDSANWSVAISGTASGLTGTLSGKTYTVSTVTADVGYVDLVATRSGFSSITKRFTVNKTRAGVDSVAYWLVSPSALVKSMTGAYSPSSITVSMQSHSGTGSPTAYQGKFVIAELTGTTWSNKYTSSSAEPLTGKSYTPSSSSIDAIRVRAYKGDVTPTDSNYVDEQTIPIVSDGVDAVYAYVWTPTGNTIKNGTGTVQVHVDIYKGSSSVNGTAFKWYEQDPTATTSSGGDSDGGAGWRLINSTYNNGITGYTTDTITVPSGAVQGQEAYKCVVTYNGVKYSGVTMVVDISDPILVRIDGVSVFKNGVGSNTYKAILLRAGEEIDAGGTTYNYAWSIYNKDGSKASFTATGKSCTVTASAINGVGNIVCDVSTK